VREKRVTKAGKIKEIVLGLTGSVAIYKSCELARRLKEEGFNLTTIMTEEATRFITPLLMEAVSGNRVYQDLFARPETHNPQHISLARRADLILIAPATANIIAKVASGLCDDLLTSTVLSTKAQVLFATAMNKEMFKKRIVQDNISKLKRLGYRFIGPVEGELVCGEIGEGCLAAVERIVSEVIKVLR
jgi:phosphopantothenoylcysteine decarboxylase/phosphopantothenate--cysteine ligase